MQFLVRSPPLLSKKKIKNSRATLQLALSLFLGAALGRKDFLQEAVEMAVEKAAEEIAEMSVFKVLSYAESEETTSMSKMSRSEPVYSDSEQVQDPEVSPEFGLRIQEDGGKEDEDREDWNKFLYWDKNTRGVGVGRVPLREDFSMSLEDLPRDGARVARPFYPWMKRDFNRGGMVTSESGRVEKVSRIPVRVVVLVRGSFPRGREFPRGL